MPYAWAPGVLHDLGPFAVGSSTADRRVPFGRPGDDGTAWTLDSGPLTLDPGPWTLDPGPWTLDPGPWTLDPGPWILDPGPWTLDPGLSTWTMDTRPGPSTFDPRPATAHLVKGRECLALPGYVLSCF